MCPRSSINFIPEKDEVEKVCFSIKNYIGKIQKLHIQGIAEPFWKDRIFEVMEILETKKYPNLKISTFTNGTVFNDSKQDRFLSECSYSLVYFSLDASSKEKYKKIRILDAFDHVVKNIEKYNKKKNERHNSVLCCNVNIHNLNETNEIVKLGKNLNFDWIEFNSTDPCDKNMDFVVNFKNNNLFAQKQKEIENLGKEIKIDVRFIKPISRNFYLKIL